MDNNNLDFQFVIRKRKSHSEETLSIKKVNTTITTITSDEIEHIKHSLYPPHINFMSQASKDLSFIEYAPTNIYMFNLAYKLKYLGFTTPLMVFAVTYPQQNVINIMDSDKLKEELSNDELSNLFKGKDIPNFSNLKTINSFYNNPNIIYEETMTLPLLYKNQRSRNTLHTNEYFVVLNTKDSLEVDQMENLQSEILEGEGNKESQTSRLYFGMNNFTKLYPYSPFDLILSLTNFESMLKVYITLCMIINRLQRKWNVFTPRVILRYIFNMYILSYAYEWEKYSSTYLYIEYLIPQNELIPNLKTTSLELLFSMDNKISKVWKDLDELIKNKLLNLSFNDYEDLHKKQREDTINIMNDYKTPSIQIIYSIIQLVLNNIDEYIDIIRKKFEKTHLQDNSIKDINTIFTILKYITNSIIKITGANYYIYYEAKLYDLLSSKLNKLN